MKFKKRKFHPGNIWIILDEFIQVRTEPSIAPDQLEPGTIISSGPFTAPNAIIPPGSYTPLPAANDSKNAAFVQSEIERAECLKIEYQTIAETIDAELIKVEQIINDHTSSEKQIEKARKRKLTLLKQRATNTRALQAVESKIDKLKSNI